MKKDNCLMTSLLLLIFMNTITVVQAEEDKTVVSGFDHIGLSVKNLDQSAQFFTDKLSFKVVGEDPKYPAKFLNNGSITITLWQVKSNHMVEFNRKNNVGLHHLALSVSSFEALDQLYSSIKDFPGVVVEFKPELAYGGPNKHMMIREPSGNRIEFIHRYKQ